MGRANGPMGGWREDFGFLICLQSAEGLSVGSSVLDLEGKVTDLMDDVDGSSMTSSDRQMF